MNPDQKLDSPHPFTHVISQIKELGSACEFGSPAPFAYNQQLLPDLEIGSPATFAHNQQLHPDLEIGWPSQTAHIQNVDSILDLCSPASFPNFEQLHPSSDLGLSTLFAHNQLDTELEFDSPAPTAHDQQFNPVAEFASPASFGQFRQLQSSLEFDSLAPPAYVTNLDSASELGSPNLLEYAQHNNQRFDSQPPQGFQYFQLQNDATGTEKLPNTAQVQVLDPRLQASSLLDFRDKKYDPTIGTLFPAINPHHHNYTDHPGSSFPIAPTQTAQYACHYPQTDMSASFPQDQAEHASGSSSPATFHRQFDKEYNGLNGDGEFGSCSMSNKS